MLMIVFAFIATILLWITYYSVEEVVVPRKEEKPNLKESFQSVFRNPPLFIVIGIFLLWNDEFHSQDGGDALLFYLQCG